MTTTFTIFKKNLILTLVITLLVTTATVSSSSECINTSKVVNSSDFVGSVASLETVDSYDIPGGLGIDFDWDSYTNHSISDVPGQPANIKAITYVWKSINGQQLTLQLSVDSNVYGYFKGIPRERNIYKWSQTYICEPYNDQLATAIALYFINLKDSTGMDDYQLAQEVANFVQRAVKYEYDSVDKGVNEYPKYVYETFVEGKGDCEDQAMLIAAIYRKLNYGTALIHLPEHMAVGLVCGNSQSGCCVEQNGRRYYFVESTCKAPIGYCNEKYMSVGWGLDIIN